MATAIARPAATAAARVKWLPLLLAIAIGLAIFMMPAQHGLGRIGQTSLAITAFTIVLWAFGAMNNGVASVLMMALLIPAGVKPSLALSGFSSGSWWVLLAVLYYGFAMQKTGLAGRISYYILSLFPASYTGILGAFFAIGAVLSFGIPSMTVRTAIMVPIAWALVQSLHLKPRGKGSALIMLTTVEMAVVPGCGLLYGSLYTHASVAEAHGETRLEEISVLCSDSNKLERVPASSMFIFIGALPRTDWLGDLVERDQRGFLLTGPDLIRDGQHPKGWTLDRDPFLLETNVPGIFAVGDVRHGSVKRVASGVGEGSVAVQFIHQYLSKV